MIILIPEKFKQINVEFPLFLQNKSRELTYKFCSEDYYIELAHCKSRTSITKKDLWFARENCLKFLTGLLTNEDFKEISAGRYFSKRTVVEKSLDM